MFITGLIACLFCFLIELLLFIVTFIFSWGTQFRTTAHQQCLSIIHSILKITNSAFFSTDICLYVQNVMSLINDPHSHFYKKNVKSCVGSVLLLPHLTSSVPTKSNLNFSNTHAVIFNECNPKGF
jgi:hypothetical protein